MLKTSEMVTITVPKPTLARIRKEAKKRQDTVSGLLRKAFEHLVQDEVEMFSDRELALLLKRDRLPSSLRRDLDRLLGRKK